MSIDQILAKVGALILQSLPTLFLVVILHFYLKAMLFKPLAKVLAERDTLTKGARETAEASIRRAEEKAAEFEKSIRDARNDLYKEQETTRKQWLSEQAASIEQARASAEASVSAARNEIKQSVAQARQELLVQADQLANDIAGRILG
jgi:F-type H+-transporting ATPase subunit b